MIKTLLTVFLLTWCLIIGTGQSSSNEPENGITQLEEFDRLNLMILNNVGWKGTNIDSAASIRLLEIAQDLDNDSLRAIAYNWIGSFFTLNKGDNVTALEYYFKALPLAERIDDKRRISSIYFDAALVYFDLKDLEMAFNMNRKGGQNLPDKSHPLYYFMLAQYEGNNVDYFLRSNQPDSAYYYALNLAKTSDILDSMNNIGNWQILKFSFLAAANSALGKTDEAETYFNRADLIIDSIESSTSNALFYRYYAQFLLNARRLDEAEAQSRKLLKIGIDASNENLMLIGASYLREVFDRKVQIDSAYHYSVLESQISNSIFSQSNKNKIASLAFNEQLRTIEEENRRKEYENKVRQYALLSGIGVILLIAFILYRNNRQKQRANLELNKALSDLKSTQSQLVHSEKMASLGELTAGIAHEIQNPLNFVNNFSDINIELAEELKELIKKNEHKEAGEIIEDIIQNEQKIVHHGKRAEDIVRSMLQHSRGTEGKKESTDINALCDEYLRLAYHGMRAKDKSFNVEMETDFDPEVSELEIVPQDIGRVVLNLITNAFHTLAEKQANSNDGFNPLLRLSTKQVNSMVEIRIDDNGTGIPEDLRKKIFQPFFSTKETGKGTGLGLSLSYDIITKGHKGELILESTVGQGSSFIIKLPT